MEQLYLPGFEPPAPVSPPPAANRRRPPRDRLFFAFLAEWDVQRSTSRLADQLAEEHGLTARPIRPGRRHVSLVHLGDYGRGLPRNAIWAAMRAADRAPAAPFDFRLDRVGSFPAFRPDAPIVLCGGEGLGGLLAFHARLCISLAGAGLERWVGPELNPHMTLFYDRRRVGWRSVEPIVWRARELTLVHSVVGRSIYNILGTWPLTLS